MGLEAILRSWVKEVANFLFLPEWGCRIDPIASKAFCLNPNKAQLPGGLPGQMESPAQHC